MIGKFSTAILGVFNGPQSDIGLCSSLGRQNFPHPGGTTSNPKQLFTPSLAY